MISCPSCRHPPTLPDPEVENRFICRCGSLRGHARYREHQTKECQLNWTFVDRSGFLEWGLFLDGQSWSVFRYVVGLSLYDPVPRRGVASMVSRMVRDVIARQVLES